MLNEGLRGTDGSAPLGPEVFQFVATAPHGDGQFIQTDMLGDDRSRHVAPGDLNGDGVLDAFIATMVGNSRVWLGVGNGEFTESSHRPPTLGITGVALGDLDGDGDLDAFLANGFTSCIGRSFDVSENTVWLNNGYGRFRDSGQRLGNGVGERVALGDVDGDGDLDAFVANSGIYTGYVSNNDQRARDRLWLNDGGGHFSRSSQDLGAWHSAAVDLGDLDEDGDLDAVVAVERDWYRDDGEWHFRPSDRVWLNDGTGRFSGSGQLLDSRRSTDVSLADLDGDGDIDAFILDISGNKLWLNNGSGAFVEGQDNRTWDVYASDAALGDLDGDGDIDVLVANDAVLFLGYTDPHGESVWLNQNTPLVQDDIYSGQENQPLVVTVPGLLANDMDPDGDPIATSLTRFPQHGTLETFNPDGSFTYAPNPDFNGTDTFAYRIADAHQESTQATVTLQISAMNDAPKAIDGFYDLVPGSPLSVSAPSGILDNGSDIDGDPLNVFLDQGPKRGTLTLNPDGSFTYTPDPETVADAFTCHIRDGFLNSDIIRIKLGNTVPVATGDLLYTFTPGTPLVVGPSFGLLAGVSDTDGDPLTVRIAQEPRGGDLALNPDGAFTYTPYPGTVTDAFNYHVTDGMAEIGIIRVKIGNTAPVAIDDPGYQTREETPLVITADAGLLANDQDLDGDVFLAMEDRPPQNGMLQLGPDGSFTYTPNDGFFGTDFFSYYLSDEWTESSVATVTISVVGGLAVVDQSPRPNAVDIAPASQITAIFNGPVDPASLTDRVSVYGSQTGPRIPAIDVDGSRVKLTTHPDFAQGERVTVTLQAGIQRSEGLNQLATPMTWEFHVASEPAPLILTSSGQSLGAGALGDLDGDGDLDFFQIHNGDPDRVWLNDGSGLYVDSNQALATSITSSIDVALGDLDGDNDLDAYVINKMGSYIWLKDGSGIFTFLWAQQGSAHDRTKDVSLGDLDGDGDLDALVVRNNIYWDGLNSITITRDSKPRILLNDGNGEFSPQQGLSLPESYAKGWDGALGDVDGDGDLDVIVTYTVVPWDGSKLTGGYLESAALYLNDGMGNYTYAGKVGPSPPPHTYSATEYEYYVELGDLDGDEALDAVFSHNNKDLSTWTNDGTGSFILGQIVTGRYVNNTGGLVQRASIGDLDGDGDQDIYLAVVPTYLNRPADILWLNNGLGRFSDSGQRVGASSSGAIELGDLDGDGDLDAVVTGNPVWLSRNRPVARDDYVEIVAGGISAAAPGILANDSPSEGGSLTAVLAQTTPGGSLVLDPDGSFTYTPYAGTVTDAFTYRAAESGIASIAARVKIGNTPPVVPTSVSYSVTAKRPTEIGTALGLLQDAGDADGDTLTAILDSGPDHGTLALNPDGSFVYAPNPGYMGPDSFVYHIHDGVADSPPITVSITVESKLALTERFPAPFVLEANTDVDIELRFDADIDSASVLGNVRIAGSVSGPHAVESYIVAGSAVTLDTSEEFAPGERVTVTLLSGLRGSQGEPLAALVQWQFDLAATLGTGSFADTGQRLDAFFGNDVALGDLDGDGDPDAVTANALGSPEAQAPDGLWQNHGGVFTKIGSLGSRSSIAVALGDMDGDGDLDAVTAGRFSDGASVWFNNGAFSFSSGTPLAVPRVRMWPWAIWTGTVTWTSCLVWNPAWRSGQTMVPGDSR